MRLVRVPVKVEPAFARWRLDRYLQQKIRHISREQVQRLIATALDYDGPGRLKPATRVAPGMRFTILTEAEPEPEAPREFTVVFDDGDLLVVDKPSGLPVHPTSHSVNQTLTALARAAFPERKVDPAHRLDRETSGLLVCGCSPPITRALKATFARGQVAKTYLALVLGAPAEERFTVAVALKLTGASGVRVRMHAAADGLPAVTEFEVLERRRTPDDAPAALLACHPHTGRQHQIRAHLQHAGLLLVGDKIYGPDEMIFDRFTRHAMNDADRAALRLSRHALHAWKLALRHPGTGDALALEAPLPADLQEFWAGCR